MISNQSRAGPERLARSCKINISLVQSCKINIRSRPGLFQSQSIAAILWQSVWCVIFTLRNVVSFIRHITIFTRVYHLNLTPRVSNNLCSCHKMVLNTNHTMDLSWTVQPQLQVQWVRFLFAYFESRIFNNVPKRIYIFENYISTTKILGSLVCKYAIIKNLLVHRKYLDRQISFPYYARGTIFGPLLIVVIPYLGQSKNSCLEHKLGQKSFIMSFAC